jgi:HxlR-like helix-turn-helix
MQKVALTKLSVGVIYWRHKERDLNVPIDVTLSVIDGRWKGTILWRLSDGPMRKNQLRKNIPEITERMPEFCVAPLAPPT